MARPLTLLLFLTLVTLAGCTTEQLEAYKQQVGDLNKQAQTLNERKDAALATTDAIAAELDAQLAAAREQASAMPDGPDKTKALAVIDKIIAEKARVQTVADEYVGKVDAELASITASIDRLDAALADADTPLGAAGHTAKEIGTVVPPPWNLIIGGVGALLLGIENRRKTKAKRALQSTVEAFEIAKREGSGVINFGERETKNALRSAMSSEAREAVDEARKVMAQKDPNKVVINAATAD